MSIMIDKEILTALEEERITIQDFSWDRLQPASVDMTLSNEFMVFKHESIIDPHKPPEMKAINLKDDEVLHLAPGGFALGAVTQRIALDRTVVGRVEGKSSIGRLGLAVHATAGFIDPGFEGVLTLELSNLTNNWILVRPGMLICQLSFFDTPGSMQRYGSKSLGSKYQNQTGPTPSRYHTAFTEPSHTA